MTESQQTMTRVAFLDSLEAHLKTISTAPDNERLLQFARIYYAYLSVDDLFSRPIEKWAEILMQHWSLINSKRDSFFNLQIVSSTDNAGLPLVQLYLTTLDMPFLVDSLSMELTRLQMNVDLILHSAGFRVLRSEDHSVMRLWPYQDHSDQGDPEAVLYFEVKKSLDDEAIAGIRSNLERVLGDVNAAVEDWALMQQEVHKAIEYLEKAPSCLPSDKVTEAKDFLSWMLSDNFIFSAFRSYEVIGKGDKMALKLNSGSGLGVLRDETNSLSVRYLQDLPEEAREQLLHSDEIIVIAKTNTESTIHRKTFTDYISVRLYDKRHRLTGELRFIGMFTSHAYAQDPKKVPILRHKVDEVLARADLPQFGHLWKDLVHIISSLPRDDLLHASVDELEEWSVGILQIQDRYKTRLFHRRDVYNRFYSFLLFTPRDTLSMSLIYRVRDYLNDRFNGISVEHQTHLFGSVLARVHFEVRVNPASVVDVNMKELEEEVVALTSSWGDRLGESIAEAYPPLQSQRLIERYRQAFGITYREHYSVNDALVDFVYIEKVFVTGSLQVSLSCGPKADTPSEGNHAVCQFKIYSPNSSVPLSEVLPILEAMGVRVLSEFPVDVHVTPSQVVWINDFTLASDKATLEEVFAAKPMFEEAFKKIISGEADCDPLNALVAKVGLTWENIRLVRAYVKYCRQIGVAYSETYIASILMRYPRIIETILHLFEARFHPQMKDGREKLVLGLQASIDFLLADISLLDEDRVLRKLLELVLATLRTNYYLKEEDGSGKPFLTLKIDPTLLTDMAGCKTKIETFVYSVLFEGIHLRVDKVARGGIRWSSRPEDYRTEVLGLVNAQLVKNAVIVPAGAKGGFVIHAEEDSFTTDELWAHGIQCYRFFIRGLLDVIDDLKDGQVIHNPLVVAYDGDDPLAVVAADRRTATFSDFANEESEGRSYWLGDAFASGGSNGYDHKKMGITARGAWVSAQRHFQEMDINLDETEVTVSAIGDMSGDVFGNGMLLSPNIKLVAAFNHKHIFLDPNPDPAASFIERRRLFQLPRSSWSDYGIELISQGGGVFDRSQKSIALSPEVQELLGVSVDWMEPNELIRAILCMNVGMLWNGGIGTYIKSSEESHDDVGDRANDALRVNGQDLRCQTVCEGGNLGLTQRGRIEYELAGGRVYSDFIDNSAGVDCSDHEVNIKILLNGLVTSGELSMTDRNALLESMSEDVSTHVLRNNYLQAMAVSDIKRRSKHSVMPYWHYMQSLEESGLMDLEAESLPNEEEIRARMEHDEGLMHPEIATLFAYTKIFLGNTLRQENLLENADLREYLFEAFPSAVQERYADKLCSHYLANEIIATQLVNALVADMGILFVHQVMQDTGNSAYAVAKAYVAASKIIHFRQRLNEIEALDHQISADLQFSMRSDIITLARRVTHWILRHHQDNDIHIADLVSSYEEPIGHLTHHLDALIPEELRKHCDDTANNLLAHGVPDTVARHMSALHMSYHGMNVIAAAMEGSHDLLSVAEAYHLLLSRLDLLFFREKIDQISEHSAWSSMARSCCKMDLEIAQRRLTLGVLSCIMPGVEIATQFDEWISKHKDAIEAWFKLMDQIRQAEEVDSAIIFLSVRQLTEFADKESVFCTT